MGILFDKLQVFAERGESGTADISRWHLQVIWTPRCRTGRTSAVKIE